MYLHLSVQVIQARAEFNSCIDECSAAGECVVGD